MINLREIFWSTQICYITSITIRDVFYNVTVIKACSEAHLENSDRLSESFTNDITTIIHVQYY